MSYKFVSTWVAYIHSPSRPLYWACEHNHTRLVDIILNNDTLSIDEIDYITSIDSYNGAKTVFYLLGKADVAGFDNVAMAFAKKNNNADIIKLLEKHICPTIS